MILEVEQNAAPQLIVSSYRRLALKLHPDRNAKHDATEAFQRVSQLSRAKSIILSMIIASKLIFTSIARTSLRDIEGRSQTSSLRPHLPLRKTKSLLSSKHTNTASNYCFDATIRNT
jgi:hypothetical protein